MNCREVKRSPHLDCPFSADLAQDTMTFSTCKNPAANQEIKNSKIPILRGDLSADSDTGPVGKAIRTQMGHQLKHTQLREDRSVEPGDGRLIHISLILLSCSSKSFTDPIIHREKRTQEKPFVPE